MHERDKK